MANITFKGPVRSQGGFKTVSIAAETGVETEVEVINSSGEIVGNVAGSAMTTGGGAGITAGDGTVLSSEITKSGKVVTTQIYIDVTGLTSSATGGDIIGVESTGAAYIGAIDFAESGQVYAGSASCLEAPTTGDADIDIYAADEATGVEDTAIGDLTETALLTAGDTWTLGETKALTAWPTDGQYIYLTVGGTTAGLYATGILLIELFGYSA